MAVDVTPGRPSAPQVAGGRGRPPAEVEITPRLVAGLLADQHPDLAPLPLRRVEDGWDNAIFRLGTSWCVRLPRRRSAAELIVDEQRWLPLLAPRLPVAVPVPSRVGRPGHGYPWPWSVCPWFDGRLLAEAGPDAPASVVDDLAGFLAALHQPAPPDAPANPHRGGPLESIEDRLRARLDEVAPTDGGDRAGALRRCWETALAAPEWSGPPTWVHGDLHPSNVVVGTHGVTAVLDFGDVTAGDPATDLAIAWLGIDHQGRRRLRRALPAVDEATWQRARGWALYLALALVTHGEDAPLHNAVGHRALAALAIA